MGKRKRHSKRQMDIQPITFNAGDSVVVKSGVDDPEYGGDISGWQGRIVELNTDEKGVPIVMITWDSLTLKRIPESFIKECERKGLSWESMMVFTHQIELSKPRDTLIDVNRMIEEIAARSSWVHLGEEGDRIQQVLKGVNEKDEMSAFRAWAKYLHKMLKLPFEAEVSEWQDRGPLQAGDRVTVLDFEDVEDLYGILVNIKTKRGFYNFPLCDLKATDQNSPNYKPLDDYDIWFANR